LTNAILSANIKLTEALARPSVLLNNTGPVQAHALHTPFARLLLPLPLPLLLLLLLLAHRGTLACVLSGPPHTIRLLLAANSPSDTVWR
jgi:hypothetical protein